MKIAVNGCSHGDLNQIYATLQAIEQQQGIKVDLLLCCGDFQAIRNVDDLRCFSCPPKYRALKDFHLYYSGKRKAPIPTLFVGGNHEAVNHLWELYYGGWAAPNIRYLGHAGVINFGGLRIGGLSGIFNARHYPMGHFERPPYTDSTMRSAYHVRELEVYRLLKIKKGLDVFMSHDWPTHVARYGKTAQLVRCKPAFRQEVETDTLGSPANWQLLQALKPRYWFAGHLHVWFSAAVPHARGGVAGPPGAPDAAGLTRFVALDKPLPKRRFLQIIDVPVARPGPMAFSYDEEWLSILRETHECMSLAAAQPRLPTPLAAAPPASAEARAFVAAALARDGAAVPLDFVRTVDPGKRGQGSPPREIPVNPQTEAFLRLIGKPWNLTQMTHQGQEGAAAAPPVANAEEIDIDDVDDDGAGDGEDPMFAPIEINSYDPHAVADARAADASRAVRQKLSDALRFVPRQANLRSDPDEIDIGDDDDDVPADDVLYQGGAGAVGLPGEGSTSAKDAALDEPGGATASGNAATMDVQ